MKNSLRKQGRRYAKSMKFMDISQSTYFTQLWHNAASYLLVNFLDCNNEDLFFLKMHFFGDIWLWKILALSIFQILRNDLVWIWFYNDESLERRFSDSMPLYSILKQSLTVERIFYHSKAPASSGITKTWVVEPQLAYHTHTHTCTHICSQCTYI